MTLALRGLKLCCFAALFVLGFLGVARADENPADRTSSNAAPAALADQVAGLNKQVQDAKLAAHNAWMLAASALVLLMTGPGLALFYGGLVRKKNVLGVMMQCIFLMGLNSVIWALWGYSLAFGGDPRGEGLQSVDRQRRLSADCATSSALGTTIPMRPSRRCTPAAPPIRSRD